MEKIELCMGHRLAQNNREYHTTYHTYLTSGGEGGVANHAP